MQITSRPSMHEMIDVMSIFSNDLNQRVQENEKRVRRLEQNIYRLFQELMQIKHKNDEAAVSKTSSMPSFTHETEMLPSHNSARLLNAAPPIQYEV